MSLWPVLATVGIDGILGFKGVEAPMIPFPQSIYEEVPAFPPQDLNLGISPPAVRDLPYDPRDGGAFIYILARST